jgi:hypothetical protein
MNIFITSKCPIESAQALANIHVNKMICESLQLLCTAHSVLDGTVKVFKPTHQNHPCSIFTRKSSGNYEWLYKHFKALCDEYTFRTGKVHKCAEHLEDVATPPLNISQGELDFDFMCMDDDCKKTLDVHKNYRYYLSKKYSEWQTRVDKRPIVATWTNRNKPDWIV